MLPRGFPIITFSAFESSPTFFFMAIRLFQNVGRSFVTCGRCQVGMFFLGAPELMVLLSTSCLLLVGYLQ